MGGLELAAALPEPPEAIVTPLGSGGTAAGLTLAVRQLGWPTRVVAVRVAPLVVANHWRVGQLAWAARQALAARGIVVAGRARDSLETVPGVGRGYGHPTPAGERARSEAAAQGLILEPTYGAKAFAALRALGAGGFQRIVFWHTFAVPLSGTDPRNDHAAQR